MMKHLLAIGILAAAGGQRLAADFPCRTEFLNYPMHRCNPYDRTFIYVAGNLARQQESTARTRSLPVVISGPKGKRRILFREILQRSTTLNAPAEVKRGEPKLKPSPPPSLNASVERSVAPSQKPVKEQGIGASQVVFPLPSEPIEPEYESNRSVQTPEYNGRSSAAPEKEEEHGGEVAAKSSGTKPRKKSGIKTVEYTIAPGDTLIAIARKFGTDLATLRRINRLKEDQAIRAGELLKVPATVTKKRVSTPVRIGKSPWGRYRIRPGDTLTGVARTFDVKLGDLLRLNGIEPHALLRSGRELKLPLPQKRIDRIVRAIDRKAALDAKRAKRLAELKKLQRRAYRLKYTPDRRFRHKIRVVATAYTSHPSQTDKTPFVAAWNNRIRPGMKIIAVSSDLIRHYGITNGTRVRISGLPGIYTVRDKMHPKWRRKIDIYMGTNRRRALSWGRRRVILYW